MTTAIIGDPHGCHLELEEMITLLEKRGVAKYVFAGDLLDKGYDSPGTVKMVRELSYTKEVVLVEGNHEERHKRFRRHLDKGTGRHQQMKNWEELQSITDGLSQDDIDWLNTAVLYHRFSLPTGNVMVVHGGVPPIIKELPSVDEIAGLSNKKRKFYSQLLRVRYVDKKGMMIMLGEESEDDPYWAEVYDGRFGHVYFGHQPFEGDVPQKYDHATGLDLGCVFGGKLCAAVLDADGTNVEFVTVDAKAQYSEQRY